ncbi:MAG: hypothetical protein M3478_11460 [Planctomycetota bacterium]|nr:hypothetical protein [Planctomycetota bacterium]
MARALPPTLDYAAAATAGIGRIHFALGACFFGLLGLAANAALIALVVSSLQQTAEAHPALLRNPRAFGREIDPTTIAALRQPVGLWVADAALILAATFGLLLAMCLIAAAVHARRDPSAAARYVERYTRWKPVAAAATAITLFWSDCATQSFWNMASRHISVGSGPPFVATAIIFLCAMVPHWWVRSASRDASVAHATYPGGVAPTGEKDKKNGK